jgi:hypothetical protein
MGSTVSRFAAQSPASPSSRFAARPLASRFAAWFLLGLWPLASWLGLSLLCKRLGLRPLAVMLLCKRLGLRPLASSRLGLRLLSVEVSYAVMLLCKRLGLRPLASSRLGLRLLSVPEPWGALAAPRLRRPLAVLLLCKRLGLSLLCKRLGLQPFAVMLLCKRLGLRPLASSRLGLRLLSVPGLWGALAAPRLRRPLAVMQAARSPASCFAARSLAS